MAKRKPAPGRASAEAMFDVEAFLHSGAVARTVVKFTSGAAIFKQGDASKHVFYIQSGGVKLSVLSKTGREALVAMLEQGNFFGEGCLAGQRIRMGSATAIASSAVLRVGKEQMVRLLHKQHAMSD